MQSQFVDITATESDPQEAADLANAFAKQTINDRTAAMHKSIEGRLPELEKLQGESPSAENAGLISKYSGLRTTSTTPLCRSGRRPSLPPLRPPRSRS